MRCECHCYLCVLWSWWLGQIRICKHLTRSRNPTHCFICLKLSAHERRKQYNFISVLLAASVKGSAVPLDCFTFHYIVFQTPLSALNVLEVSIESQHGQDGQYPALGCRLIWCRKHFGNCTEVMHLPEHNPKQNKVTKDFSFPLALLLWCLLWRHLSSHSCGLPGEARHEFLIQVINKSFPSHLNM